MLTKYDIEIVEIETGVIASHSETKKDRIEINSLEYTNLGLIQFTRKRQGKELAFYYKEKCQYCEGTGYFLSKDRIILNLLEDLNAQIKSQDIKKIVIRTKKDIIKKEFTN